jgi:hypothetical protein
MAHSAEIATYFYCTASFCAVAQSIQYNQIRHSGPQRITKFATVVHSI